MTQKNINVPLINEMKRKFSAAGLSVCPFHVYFFAHLFLIVVASALFTKSFSDKPPILDTSFFYKSITQ